MGMSTRVGRRIAKATCHCIIIENNEVVHKDYVLYGDYSEPKRATKAIEKQYGIESVLVESIDMDSTYYSMPIETFIANADKASKQD